MYSVRRKTKNIDLSSERLQVHKRRFHRLVTIQALSSLKPPFSANPSHRSISFLLQDRLLGLPGLFTDTFEHIRFYFFGFSRFFPLLVVGSVR